MRKNRYGESIIVLELWLPIQPADRPPHPQCCVFEKSCRTLPAPKTHQSQREPQRSSSPAARPASTRPRAPSATWRFFELGIPVLRLLRLAADDPSGGKITAAKPAKLQQAMLNITKSNILPVWSAKQNLDVARRKVTTFPDHKCEIFGLQRQH